ncbi:MAG: tail protein X [Alphaproteobacteria bacterium]|nr:tail protein X [Alphaproteobacteria bacterium]
MAGTYITRDGDRIDQIGQRVYGTPAVAELLAANPRLAGWLAYPSVLLSCQRASTLPCR